MGQTYYFNGKLRRIFYQAITQKKIMILTALKHRKNECWIIFAKMKISGNDILLLQTPKEA
jgi:hypothetical protein